MSTLKSVLLTAVLLWSLGFFYLYPGSTALLEGRTDAVMSDGTDPMTLPYQYDRVFQIWKNRPSHLFYGAVYDAGIDGDRGTALWMPWSERWLVILFSYFFPVEQVSTAFVWTLLVFNGIALFAVGRFLGWGYFLSFGLAAAWAFNAYTRARAKVHGALAGLYHLPLIFLGLLLVARGKSYRSVALAAVAFLISATTAHYYLVTCVFLSPFFLAFLAIQPEFRKRWRPILLRLTLAVLPAVFFLGFNRWVTVPPGAPITTDQSMNNEWLNSPQISPFLFTYRAFPVDYLGGDLSLGQTGDLNPLRDALNGYILGNLEGSNAHERTNGVRWLILLLSVAAIAAMARKGALPDQATRSNILFFCAFGGFAFWMSLGPEAPIPQLSPAYWLYSFDHHVRVANRAAVNAHFALLMIVGLFLSQQRWFHKSKWAPPVFALAVLLDYAPVQEVTMAAIRPAYTRLQRDGGPCGQGMFFPYINQWNTSIEYYAGLQKMRRSDCPILNAISDPKKAAALVNKFPPAERYLLNVHQIPGAADDLVRFAQCVPLNWIAFHEATSPVFAQDVCRRLGWTFNDDFSCIAPDKNRAQQGPLERCL